MFAIPCPLDLRKWDLALHFWDRAPSRHSCSCIWK